MDQSYVYRYMNISKCDLIKKIESCSKCGWELSITHHPHEDPKMIAEHAKCPKCGQTNKKKVYLLH